MVKMNPVSLPFKGLERNFQVERKYDMKDMAMENAYDVKATQKALSEVKDEFLKDRSSDNDVLKIIVSKNGGAPATIRREHYHIAEDGNLTDCTPRDARVPVSFRDIDKFLNSCKRFLLGSYGTGPSKEIDPFAGFSQSEPSKKSEEKEEQEDKIPPGIH